MNTGIFEQFVPGQERGGETETYATLHADSDITARIYFQEARKRLEDVNNWQEISGVLSSEFVLTDDNGTPFSGGAAEGLFIRIDIPGPGTRQGDGYDWVQIEKVEAHTLNEEQEVFFIQVRPAANPGKPDDHTAHFLKDDATSTFMLSREGTEIRATVYGRNELPNTEDVSHAGDKLRNAIVGSTGVMGISKLQWKALAKGMLDVAEDR